MHLLYMFALQLLFGLLSIEGEAYQGRTLNLGRDHGRLDIHHERYGLEFSKKFADRSGLLCEIKVQNFLKQLKLKKKSLSKDLFETRRMEKTRLEVHQPKKAKKKAKKYVREKNNKILIIYNNYLIPKIKDLLQFSREGRRLDDSDVQATIQDFLRGYGAFYAPNAQRTPWHNDDDLLTIGKHVLVPYKFREKDNSKSEAFNLWVDEHHRASIERCLEHPSSGPYLNPDEIRLLIRCGFDLSKLNPGVSALWKRSTSDEVRKRYSQSLGLFPGSDDRLTFDKVRLNGVGSPKITAIYRRNGKKIKIKVKTGPEVHSDLASSLLAELVGLNQDRMLYRDKIRVFLGKTSYAQFASEFISKYSYADLVRFVTSHGRLDGEDWIEFRDAIFEARPASEMRISPIDIDNWDLSNRREYRALLLFFAWLGIGDTKLSNYKLVFSRRNPDEFYPLHRLQDMGYSLGAGLYMRRIKHAFQIPSKYKINEFETNIVSRHDREKVKLLHVWWNDFHNRHRKFKQSTWADLKWMARKIAMIRDQDLTWALTEAGIPSDIIPLYRHKLALRRNNIVECFELDDEYPLYSVPDLKHYSPNPAVKKGKVVKTYFEGKNDLVISPRNFFSFLAERFDLKTPTLKLSKQFRNRYQDQKRKGCLELSPTGVCATSEWSVGDGRITADDGAAVGLQFSRKVRINQQLLASEGKGRPFRVVDRIAVGLNIGSGYLDKLIKLLPVRLSANVRVYNREIEYVHYAESLKEAFLKPFSLFKILFKIDRYVVNQLKPLELIKIEDRYGLEGSVSVDSLSIDRVIENRFAHASGWVKSSPLYFIRDGYGSLHIYREKTKTQYTASEMKVLGLSTLSIPLVGLGFTYNRYFHEAVDYAMNVSQANVENASVQWRGARRREQKILNSFLHSKKEEYLDQAMEKRFSVRARGFKKTTNSNFLYYFGRNKVVEDSSTHVTTSNGQQRKFYRRMIHKRTLRGTDKIIPGAMRDVTVKKSRRVRILYEVDEQVPEQEILLIHTEHFRRKLSRRELLKFIDFLNGLYSKSESKNFFRDFELPPDSQVDIYRKLYAGFSIYVKPSALINALAQKDMRELMERIQTIVRHTSLSKPCQSSGFKKFCSKISTNFRLGRVKRALYKLKEAGEKEKPRRELIRRLEDFLYRLKLDDTGVLFLREILNRKEIFVMGEISGIYRSFSNLQDLQQLATKRFAGKSWGKFNGISPIQHFLRYGHYIVPSLFLSAGAWSYRLFGGLDRALAPSS
tara:strand:- start:2533 stop:6294 length:3762 start_codon:yes stop_codon:yes gene_type:complete